MTNRARKRRQAACSRESHLNIEALEQRRVLATLVVTVGGDAPGATGTLRGVIEQANATVGVPDIVEFSPSLRSSFIRLSNSLGQIEIMDDLEIRGAKGCPQCAAAAAAGSGFTVKAAANSRVFEIGDVNGTIDVTIKKLTIVGGDPSEGSGGGILVNGDADLHLIDSTLTGNSASSGGGLALLSDYVANGADRGSTITNSTISGNYAGQNGGGVYAFSAFPVLEPGGANLVITNSEISDNMAVHNGGGVSIVSGYGAEVQILNTTITGNAATGNETGSGGGLSADLRYGSSGGGTIKIDASTIDHNTATYDGGGARIVSKQQGLATITNSTFFANTAHRGGGVFVGQYGPTHQTSLETEFNHTTITGNVANVNQQGGLGGGLFVETQNVDGTIDVTLQNTIISMNDQDNFVPGSYTGTANLIDEAPLFLQSFGDWGGPTFTMPPTPKSPAIDAGSNGLLVDQRGQPRPECPGGVVDIGAVERQKKCFRVDTIVGSGSNASVLGAVTQDDDSLDVFESSLANRSAFLATIPTDQNLQVVNLDGRLAEGTRRSLAPAARIDRSGDDMHRSAKGRRAEGELVEAEWLRNSDELFAALGRT